MGKRSDRPLTEAEKRMAQEMASNPAISRDDLKREREKAISGLSKEMQDKIRKRS